METFCIGMTFLISLLVFPTGIILCEDRVKHVLVVGDKANIGYVHVYSKAVWYTLCYDGWNHEDAAVVCRMLGYMGDGALALYDESNIRRRVVWDQTLDCNGNETSLEQCKISQASHACISSKSARVHCPTENYEPDDIFLLAFDSGIGRMDRKSESITVVMSDNSYILHDIEYDDVEMMVIWTEFEGSRINRCSINGGDKLVVYQAESISRIAGIAIDSKARLIFYTDNGRKEIGVINADNFNRSVIVSDNLGFPFRIDFDPCTREVYWTDFGKDTIEKASYDGTSRKVIVSTDLSWPLALVLDGIYLYWCATSSHIIERTLKNGTDRKFLYQAELSHCMDLAQNQDYLYCKDYNKDQISVFKKDGSSFSVAGSPAIQGGYYNVYYYNKANLNYCFRND